MDERIFIGLGSNLGDREANFKAALRELGTTGEVRVVRCSSFHEYDPVEAPPPKFLNAVAEVATGLPPADLLARLREIEARLGRTRPYPNAPRTIDLDLLLYGDRRVSEPGLTLPHQRMAERRFVMEPLAEIAPEVAAALSGSAATRSGGEDAEGEIFRNPGP